MDVPNRLRPESVEAMFRTHYAALVQSLTLVAGDRDTAEDAVQEAFAQAHLRWVRVSAYDEPVAWVRRVALNRLFNRHRRSRRQMRALRRLGAIVPDRPDEAVQVIDQLDLDAALRDLPLNQRASLVLYYVDDLPVAEIAAALGVSEGTIKTHLHRARQAVRPAMEALQ